MSTAQEVAADIAAELRITASRWTAESNARDACGTHTGVKNSDAVCWCLFGHILRRCGDRAESIAYAMQEIAGIPSIVAWNDKPGRTVAEVIDLCEKIAAAA
jgi:hypothetical protein